MQMSPSLSVRMKKHIDQRLRVSKFHKTALVSSLVLVVLSMQAAVIMRSRDFLPFSDPTPLLLSHPSQLKKCLTCSHKGLRRNEPETNAFGACLMVKDDNELLYEWLAYHYTMLPLGFLVVGSDLGNSQDPQEVLGRWKGLNLTTRVLEPDDFINRHGNYDQAFGRKTVFASEKERTNHHHHALIHRQKGFISTCAEMLKANGVGWTLMIDTDEFLVPNPMTTAEEVTMESKKGLGMTSTTIQARRMISDAMKHDISFVDIIHALQELDNKTISGSCYTIPRLLVGALDNETCPGVEQSATFAKSVVNGRFSLLSTLRFFQHARKGDFAFSKFGKVFVDLRAIEDETVSLQVPANIHRPYKQHCKSAGGVSFADSYFFLLHYIGSWERYASRSDDRRNRAEWEVRSNISDETSACAAEIWRWFPLFARRVGRSSAEYLLGGSLLAR